MQYRMSRSAATGIRNKFIMKILYAIQGTGNGHVCRAIDIIPFLKEYGEVDILVSGIQSDIKLPFNVKYKFKGLSFIFGKKGGVDLWKTIARADLRNLRKAILSLPVDEYDLIISDFEPVSAWACSLKNKKCIGLSHQVAVLDPDSPKSADTDYLGSVILAQYAPTTTSYGFHFQSYNENTFTPVIRRSVRDQIVSNQGHYTVYLPAYDDQTIIKRLGAFRDHNWQVFSKHNRKPAQIGSISIQPVDNDRFTASMAASAGVLCGAGFETPSEALFLGKKLLVIPMKNQYEQQLNAAALSSMGVPVIKSLKPKHHLVIQEWLIKGRPVKVDYPNITGSIVEMIVAVHAEKVRTRF
jgi:uncharacterized protein (TIGR00661 family)